MGENQALYSDLMADTISLEYILGDTSILANGICREAYCEVARDVTTCTRMASENPGSSERNVQYH